MLHTEAPLPLLATIRHKPADPGDVYQALATVPLLDSGGAAAALFDAAGAPVGSFGPVFYEPNPAPSQFAFAGLATGGTVDYVIDGIPGSLVTEAGWTAADVAAALAAEINGDPAHAIAGISAIHEAGTTTIFGALDDLIINDAGLASTSIPTLSIAALALLLACLVGTALVFARRPAR